MVSRRVVISGDVQGVYLRVSAKEKAEELGIRGWIKNLPDGQVEALFQGTIDNVTKMLAWCRQGTPKSRIDSVDVEELEGEPLQVGFTIIG